MNTHPRKPRDFHLIRACLEGRMDAKSQLYNSFFLSDKPVHFWVYQKAFWIPLGEKEDILHDIYIAVLQSLPKFEFRSALSTYVVRIAKIKCLDAMPSRMGVARGRGIKFVDIDWFTSNTESGLQIKDPDPNNGPGRIYRKMEEDENMFLLEMALKHNAGSRCRCILELYLKEMKGELTREDIARLRKVSVQRAGQMIYDCMYRLRRKMQGKYRDLDHFTHCVCEGARVRKRRKKKE